MREKKIRGIKRKTENMVNRIEENTLEFPTEFYNGYWHMHLPVGQGFISSDKTPRKAKRLCIQTLVDRAEYLKGLQPHDEEKYRVTVFITLPSLWNSQIIIFKGEDYFKDFFNRDSDYYKWIPLSDNRNIQTDWELAVPDDFAISGFKEVIDDEDGYYESEIWFIEEIK
ncbi:hypothetical protein Plano_1008 [Planococcus sp. PAMC 21323]|uniref:DUF3916 domain-containing protein n=1 Tax=Planococcus sp. PAMC 21323 TaxID=1526927 RepID=UPI000571D6EE|nr:DUF3916 domain-containing protein [Planococcus sp. PAMC 21323]AIY04973.1 hypothetical protein Plano_1008 [Planococcus sp. PAMC 21323]